MSSRLNILYVGVNAGTSKHRFLALQRLGHQVTILDPYTIIPTNKFVQQWKYRTGSLGLAWPVRTYLMSRIGKSTFDLIMVDCGDVLPSSTLRELKRHGRAIANFNPDNPYIGSDKQRWRLFLESLPEYDLVATPRLSSSEAALRMGAKRVLTVNFAADEIVHRPLPMSAEDHARFAADVAFVGTWMPGRAAFMQKLVDRGVPLRIYGGRWDKAPEYQTLQANIILGNLAGDSYVKAVQGARIAIGILNKTYEDLHTTRSLEIPAIGTLFCAQRTADHLAMYKENEEAVFWDDADECATRCLDLLAHSERIDQIAAAGQKRAYRNGNFNEQVMTKIVEAALEGRD